MNAQVMVKLAFQATIGQVGLTFRPRPIHNPSSVIFIVLMSYMSLEGTCMKQSFAQGTCMKQSFAQKGNLQLQSTGSLIGRVCIQQTLPKWPFCTHATHCSRMSFVQIEA